MWKEVLSPPALSTRVPPRTVIAAGVAASFLLIGAGVMGLNHSVLKFDGWPAGERAHRVVTQVVRPPLQYRQDHPGEALRALERGRAAVPGLPAAAGVAAAERSAGAPARHVSHRKKARHRHRGPSGAKSKPPTSTSVATPSAPAPTVTATASAPARATTTPTTTPTATAPAVTASRLRRSGTAKGTSRDEAPKIKATRDAAEKVRSGRGPKPGRGWEKAAGAAPAAAAPAAATSPRHGRDRGPNGHGRPEREGATSVSRPGAASISPPGAPPVSPPGPPPATVPQPPGPWQPKADHPKRDDPGQGPGRHSK